MKFEKRNPEDRALMDIVEAVDEMDDIEVTEWEGNFIDDCKKRWPFRFSAAQRDVVERLEEKYLS